MLMSLALPAAMLLLDRMASNPIPLRSHTSTPFHKDLEQSRDLGYLRFGT